MNLQCFKLFTKKFTSNFCKNLIYCKNCKNQVINKLKIKQNLLEKL